MALADRLNDATPKRKPSGLPCSVQALLDKLVDTDPVEYTALHDALFKHGLSASKIHDSIVAEGHDVGYQTINRHRAGSCRCFR